ncbi:MAG: DUF2314 domain-containing protein [Labilithrix sp.]|nr:DUF2314 domain-containing protein [Labilithrix sp.]
MGDTGPRGERKQGSAAGGRRNGGASNGRPGGRRKGASDARLYGGLGAIVGALAALVWWSLPGDRPPGASAGDAPDELPTTDREDPSAPRAGLVRPPRASAELAVLTDEADDVVRRVASVAELAKRLDVRHCGGACDAVKKVMADEDAFEIDILKADDLILPPEDTMDTVAPGLTPSERASARAKRTAVVIRTQGDLTREQMPARAVFAAAAELSESLAGFVYDEVARRLVTADDARSHAIVVGLGEPAFARKHIVIQLYRQDDGTARLLSLGMQRFGSPDLSIRGANMAAGPMLAEIINAAASQIAHGASGGAVTVTLADVARVIGKKPAELGANADSARPVELDVVTPERIEGDPANEMAELVPREGATREAWDAIVATLFGVAPVMTAALDDPELAAVAEKARQSLPAAIERFKAGAGELFVKGPFPVPEEARVDGGAVAETLWLAAASCDAQRCTGVLSNEPSYATNIALGKTTSVKRAEAVDWMIQQRDGGVTGGESIKVLRSRVPR